MDPACPTQEQTLAELARRAPTAPFLALGQTVFWDEPMKAGLAARSAELGHGRRFVAAVHDTDYFAKAPGSGDAAAAEYAALPHNDSSTKGLWSAAGEFATLFGSETVVTREKLAAAGAKLSLLEAERPGTVDEITEAWGWRGVVGRSAGARTTAETRLDRVWPVLWSVFDQMVETAERIAGAQGSEASARLRATVCDASDGCETLADLYERLARPMFELVAGRKLEIETSRTTRLLRFGPEDAGQDRFRLLAPFLDPSTREAAAAAYDESVAGTETYPLARFGTGALPFDVLIPGQGRGTLLLGEAGGVVQTPHPVGFRYRKRPESPGELAEVLHARFGPGCVLLGKAVTLVPMLAAEHVFVFHAGASGYVASSRRLMARLRQLDPALPRCLPILRIEYATWDALDEVAAWFELPEPLRVPFGTQRISACGFAARWRTVGDEQEALLLALARERRPLGLIGLLAEVLGGAWRQMSAQFERETVVLAGLNETLAAIREAKAEARAARRAAAARRAEAERALGEHWRAKVWGKPPSEADQEGRARLRQAVEAAVADEAAARAAWARLDAEQAWAVSAPEVEAARARRRTIAVEAEFARARLVQSAVFATEGLARAGRRPSAWWFPLVSPDGEWFRATARRAQYCLEELD